MKAVYGAIGNLFTLQVSDIFLYSGNFTKYESKNRAQKDSGKQPEYRSREPGKHGSEERINKVSQVTKLRLEEEDNKSASAGKFKK